MATGGVREIPLTKGHVALVDEADYEWLSQWKWCVTGPALRPYAARGAKKAEKAAGIKPGLILMHREIVRPQVGAFIDHIDGNPLNNTRANLRTCSLAENARNVGPRNSRGLKGAFPLKDSFQAVIIAGGVRHYLGIFPTVEAAARAYDAAALRLHGEFARLNYPEAA